MDLESVTFSKGSELLTIGRFSSGDTAIEKFGLSHSIIDLSTVSGIIWAI